MNGDGRYRVWLSSVTGDNILYRGGLDVWASGGAEAVAVALSRLSRFAFPEGTTAMWKVDKVERLFL